MFADIYHSPWELQWYHSLATQHQKITNLVKKDQYLFKKLEVIFKKFMPQDDTLTHMGMEDVYITIWKMI